MAKFTVGDRVKLKSGGPQMTVNSVNEYAGGVSYDCKWFAGSKLQKGRFSEEALESYEEDD